MYQNFPRVALVVGAPFDGPGKVLMFGHPFTQTGEFRSSDWSTAFGSHVTLCRDLDGDLYQDVLVGLSHRDALETPLAMQLWSGGVVATAPTWELGPIGGSPFTVADLGRRNGGSQGAFATSYTSYTGLSIYDYSPFLIATKSSVSASAGGAFRYDLDFPLQEAGARYAMLASAAGTGPSELLGVEIPLTIDALFLQCLVGNAPAVMDAPYGELDPNGDARVIVRVPAGAWSALVGRTMHAAAISYGSWNELRLSSAAVATEILP